MRVREDFALAADGTEAHMLAFLWEGGITAQAETGTHLDRTCSSRGNFGYRSPVKMKLSKVRTVVDRRRILEYCTKAGRPAVEDLEVRMPEHQAIARATLLALWRAPVRFGPLHEHGGGAIRCNTRKAVLPLHNYRLSLPSLS